MSSKLINSTKTDRGKSGTKWHFTYRVQSESINEYRYAYKDSADSLTGGTNTYVLNCSDVKCGKHYRVDIVAVTEDYEFIENFLVINDRKGTRYKMIYNVSSDDIPDYTYEYLDNADTLTGGSGTYVTQWERRETATGYRVFITAVSDTYETIEYFSREKDRNGTRWTFVYKVAEADIATYDYEYGDSADSLTGGSGTYIITCNRKSVENGYFVFVTAVSSTYETLSQITKEDNRSGTRWTFVYKVAEVDIGDYEYEYSDNADALTGGSGTYVYTWQRKSVDGYYFVLIVAVSSGYESGGSYISSPSKTYRSYGCSTIKMLPEWWGLRRAQLSEVYYQTGGVNVKIPDDDRLLNIFNSPCEVGDYIARDATPESPGTPDRDSDYPFTEDLSIELIREYVGQEMSVPTFYVKFATNKAIGGFEDWYGVNGSFGTSSTSPSTTSSGKWKAVKQTVKEDQKIGSGTYNIVERWCVGTPTINSSKLTYDSDKNGGTWTW